MNLFERPDKAGMQEKVVKLLTKINARYERDLHLAAGHWKCLWCGVWQAKHNHCYGDGICEPCACLGTPPPD